MTKKRAPAKKVTSIYRYNWRPDLPDYRDHLLSERLSPAKVLPKSIDLRKQCSPISNQGHVGSCTGNALAGAIEFLERKELRSKTPAPEEIGGAKFAKASRLFIYFNERDLEGHAEQDAGGRLRDGVKALQQFGVCRETLWPYEELAVLERPNTKAYIEAKNHRISEYLRIQNLRELKQALSIGFTVAFGFTVFSSFETPDVAQTGLMPLPQPDEQVLGGHAVLAVGYDDIRSVLIVRNSWGENWGDRGYFYMPYDYIEKLKLAQDFWLVRK
jgi:C1A family cysteine protease